jgi:hypothetical protein
MKQEHYWNTHEQLLDMADELIWLRSELEAVKSSIAEMRALLVVHLNLDEHIDLGGMND